MSTVSSLIFWISFFGSTRLLEADSSISVAISKLYNRLRKGADIQSCLMIDYLPAVPSLRFPSHRNVRPGR